MEPRAGFQLDVEKHLIYFRIIYFTNIHVCALYYEYTRVFTLIVRAGRFNNYFF